VRERWHGLATLLVLAALLLTACSPQKKQAEEEEPPTPVQVNTVTRGPIDLIVEADAVLNPINQASVTPKISAPVKRVLVNRGDHVKANQLLAELENRDLVSAAAEAKSQIDQAEAALATISGATVPEDRAKSQADVTFTEQALEAAKRVYESRIELEKQGALARKLVDDAKVAMVQAQSQYDTARSHLEAVRNVSGTGQINVAKAQSAAATAHYQSAMVQASYAEIRSPINGIVSDRPVFPGEMAAAGTPLISIVDISKVIAKANISIREAAAIKIGKQATIVGSEGTLNGRVTVVSPAVNPGSTTVEVWIEADNPGEVLKPGGAVHVSIRADLIQDTLLVPTSAILNFDEGGEKVMVVGKDKKAHERKVTVGIREGARAQILSGVTAGEQVVTSGGLGLDDKAKVEVKEGDDDDDDDDDDDAPAAPAAKPSPAAPAQKK
jgi:multidrug efflux pump subunit AcrA (membrane-fusion protein)